MYQTLLSDYEGRQKDLLVENGELKKVLQQMKKEMISILSPRKHSQKGETIDDSLELVSDLPPSSPVIGRPYSKSVAKCQTKRGVCLSARVRK